MRAIVEERGATQTGDDARRIAALYASFMDVERVEALGVAPLRPLLDEIAAAAGPHRARRACSAAASAQGRVSLFGSFVCTDAKDSEPLPRAPEPVRARAAGRVVLPRRLLRRDPHGLRRPPRPARRAGGPRRPARLAEQVMELETALAAASWDRVTNRDAEKTYTLMTVRRAARTRPAFDWDAWLDGAAGAPEGAFAEIVVRQPSFVDAAADAVGRSARSRSGRRGWRIRTASACADFLNDAVVQEDFAFYGRTLSGTPQLRERWKRGVSLVEGALGEAVGQLYVERHFPRGVQGADGHARREPRRGLPAEHLRRSTGWARRPGSGRWRSSPSSRPRSATRTSGRTTRRSTCSADDLLGNVLRAGAWAHRPRAGQDRQAGRPRRVAHDPADGQRLLPPAA